MNVWGKKICISHSRESISWDLFGYGWQHQHSHGGRLAEELTEKICLSLEQSGPPPSPQKTWPKKTECNWKPDSTRPGGFLFFLFLDLCFAMMMSPEVGIAHREKVSQEFLVKCLLGRIDSPSSFFFVPRLCLWTETMCLYNCFSLKILEGWKLASRLELTRLLLRLATKSRNRDCWTDPAALGVGRRFPFWLTLLLLLLPFAFPSLPVSLLSSFPPFFSLHLLQVLPKYQLCCRYHTDVEDKEISEKSLSWGVHTWNFPCIF